MTFDFSRRTLLQTGAGAIGAAGGASLASPHLENSLAAEVRVTEFMSPELVADLTSERPTLDSSAAFQAAWAAVRDRGGVLLIPPGNYLLAQPWRCDVGAPANIRISGWGARLFAGPALGTFAMQVRGSFNEYLLDIEGLAFDHRGHSGVEGCLEVLGGHCVHIRRCVVEYAAVRKDYCFVRIAADTGALRRGETRDDRSSFWCKVEGCSIRRRSGADPGQAASFLHVIGAANALAVVDNCIQHCEVGIRFEPDPQTGTLANGVVVERNAFETIERTGIRVSIAAGAYGPTGLRIVHNRFEKVPVAFEVVGGAGGKIHSQPPFLFANYYTTGSVETVVENRGDYPVSVLETRYPGFGPAFDNDFYLSGNLRLRFAEGQNLHLGGYDGSANWDRGRLHFGREASLWFAPADGRLHASARAPKQASDGSLID